MGSHEEEGDKGKKKKTKKTKEKYVDQEELNKTKLHMPHQCALMGEGKCGERAVGAGGTG